MSSAICFNLDQSKILSSVYGLISPFLFLELNLFKFESTSGEQNKYDMTDWICIRWTRKYCYTKRKCWLEAIFPFPTMLQKVCV